MLFGICKTSEILKAKYITHYETQYVLVLYFVEFSRAILLRDTIWGQFHETKVGGNFP